eukprot:TRINITY_DN17925_c0_g1_i1.p1 TRINITY_DN17925_c0_g1~~TRINITY_DN17925_c0_g1_i1.p1  ORF type:complete len:361 (+),score=106.48 TRINITY_DN17925_c0_g1_i1:79-1083(+)
MGKAAGRRGRGSSAPAGGAAPPPRGKAALLLAAAAAAAAALWRAWRSAPGELGGGFAPAPFVRLTPAAPLWTSDAFVSPAEAAHLVRLVDSSGGWKASPTAGPLWQVPADGERLLRAMGADPLVAELELRIANATGIPPHEDEDALSFARIHPRPGPRGGYFLPHGLHHETDTRPNRARSVIIYLSTPLEGGRTAFPLAAGAPADPSRAARHREFDEALQGNFGGAPEGYARQVSFDPEMDHPFNDMMEETCRGSYGASVEPRRGRAALFDHIEWPADPADPLRYQRQMWHCGCNVVRGEKVMVTKFKELPRALRPSATRAFSDGRYQPWRPRR